MTIVRCVLTISFVGSLIVFGQATEPWEGLLQNTYDSATLRTRAVRCLASSVYTLSREYHLRSGYEDAPFESTSDIVDITAPGKGLGLHIFVPRGGPLRFTFAVDPVSHKPSSFETAFQKMLDAYRQAGYPGTYSLTMDLNRIIVAPVKLQSSSGQFKKLSSVLDSEVLLSNRPPATLDSALRDVLSAVSDTAGSKIVLGRRLPNQWASIPFSGSGFPQPARQIIDSIFDLSGDSICWLLLYDPTFHYYVFTPYST